MGDSNITLSSFLDNYGKEELTTEECDTAIEAFVAFQMQRAVAKESARQSHSSVQNTATNALNQIVRQD